MTARNAVDPDLWWHLRTGQWIVETGHVPHSDPFSFTRAGHAWVSHEWLSEVVFYELWKHGGTTALIVFSAIITTAGFMLLYLRCPGKKHWAAAATVLGALASAPSWGVRPQMFTFTLASLLLWLLEGGTNSKLVQKRKRSAPAAALDTAAVSPMAESARRIRARPRVVVGLWCRPDLGDCRRQHALAGCTPHPPAGAARSAGLFGSRAPQPQRPATVSLSFRYFTIARDAVVHW